jgi:hypothetical protein
MRKNLKYSVVILSLLMSVVFLPSCKDFLNPDQELDITSDKMFDDWYEYRSVAMGLYNLQQQLVEQLMVLGELRGDLLKTTSNANADLAEIYNFQVSKTNKYADPTNFYKLISACNSLITQLKKSHPEVTDKTRKVSELGNYDKLYGEVLCMRAWAYFNAVRIYGKIPVIHESLSSVEEIEAYLNSTQTYVDNVRIVFGRDGFYNDTTFNQSITLTKQFYDIDMVIKEFTKQLEQDVRVVGVNHYSVNSDKTWEVTIWNTYALNALLGQMYLTSGDLAKAATKFNIIADVYDPDIDYRYQLDNTFSTGLWRNIFTRIDRSEHIFTLNFDKANQQQNDFQNLFESWGPHQYMLKPTKAAIDLWETTWSYYSLVVPDATKPWLTTLSKTNPGIPSDFYRGYGTSYIYMKNGSYFSYIYSSNGTGMLNYKMKNDVRTYTSMMDGFDTIVFKYSINKQTYDEDANFIIYRAAGIQLYLAEIYTWLAQKDASGVVRTNKLKAMNIVNDGSNYNVLANRAQLGIRGRVGFTAANNGLIQVGNINYTHDPYTNKVTGYIDFSGNGKEYDLQKYMEEKILDEKARELAFEGERFYDLMRVAKRRNDPSFLAKKVSAKYPSGMRESIYNLLLDEKNWYIKMFD